MPQVFQVASRSFGIDLTVGRAAPGAENPCSTANWPANLEACGVNLFGVIEIGAQRIGQRVTLSGTMPDSRLAVGGINGNGEDAGRGSNSGSVFA